MTVAPFEHPFLCRLLGDEEVSGYFAVDCDLQAMLAFEAALARAEASEGVIPTEAAEAIAASCARFQADPSVLAEGTHRDGVVVPALVAQLRQTVGAPHASHVHFGATSQDVVDTSLMLRLKSVLAVLDRRLAQVVGKLDRLSAEQGGRVVMGRTRMQQALPIPLVRRINSWKAPLEAHRGRLFALKPRLLALQFGGAVGTREKLGSRGDAVTARLAKELDLAAADPVWHATRERIAELASVLSLISGGLGKMGQDIVLMAQNEVAEVRLTVGGGSSAMPHKSNPVAAEVLIALARFNATLVGGMHHALVHECERSGAAWTLEWMLLPQMLVATGASLCLATELLDNADFAATKRA
jgi:3-carboxy-cis,cis-muconate cycloisomerase